MYYRLEIIQYYQREMLGDDSSSRQMKLEQHVRRWTLAEYCPCNEL